jgi:hypothetical protein
LVWQTKLVADGFKVSTAFSHDVPLCADLGNLLRVSGFSGKYLIIESIERFFQQNMNSNCKNNSHYKAVSTGLTSPPPVNRLRSSGFDSGFSFGVGWSIKVFVNEIQLKINAIRPKEGLMAFGGVQVSAMDGCRFFSNKLCNYGLFYNQDFSKETFVSTDKVLELNQSLQRVGIQAIWLIIPDKSTVYLGYGRYNKYPYNNIWHELDRYPELTAPDLGEEFIQKAINIKDFYAPNNTHLSTEGYLYLGSLVSDKIKFLESINHVNGRMD